MDFDLTPPGDGVSDLVRREAVTKATMAKYRHTAHDWKAGITCVHMARSHLRLMGHKCEPLPRLRSLIAAKRALAERGWAGTAEMLDAQTGLMRIAPAAMLPADLAVAPDDAGLGALLVCVSPGKLIGWHEAAETMVVIDIPLDQLSGVWRV